MDSGLTGVVVRNLRAADLDRVVRIDGKSTGRSRRDYFQKTIDEATALSGSRISLGAELEEQLIGFLLVRIYHGEFGLPEPKAVIDAVGVDPEYRSRGVGMALLERLEEELRELEIEVVQTHVDWQYLDLIGFLGHAGFEPTPVVTLEKRLR
jgi:ribosomal protein S18 acetylase RimI-like enzyme